jgi:hypothetical protein
VIGNTDATVGNVKSVEVLWESFGTDEMPNVGDLITAVSYKNGYIRFSTPENFRDGNAVVAAKNSKGTILWSWHIWCAKEGWQEQVYPSNVGILMDRNIGATSATPGNAGALGLMFQWGRKDPFLGSSSIENSILALSTGLWMKTSEKISHDATQKNPMSFYTGDGIWDRSYLPAQSWGVNKTIYDPCPVGWKVPEGGDNGVWDLPVFDTRIWDPENKGLKITLDHGVELWYPAAGYLANGSGMLFGFGSGYYWSCSAHLTTAAYSYYLAFSSTFLNPTPNGDRLYAYPVRCCKE